MSYILTYVLNSSFVKKRLNDIYLIETTGQILENNDLRNMQQKIEIFTLLKL